jgi:hypothetical protein
MPVEFKHIQSEHIKDAFLKAYHRFPKLHTHQLTVRQRRMERTTMNAQPVFNRHFFSRKQRRYLINISNTLHLGAEVRLEDLPKEVLVGWFAHELGHLYDYLNRSAFNLLGFGLGYLWLPNYRTGAERKADLYAIEQGFGQEIITTKKFILEQSDLSDAYKSRIEAYYMSADEVALLVEGAERDDLRMDRLV